MKKYILALVFIGSYWGMTMSIEDIKKEISTCPESPNCISSMTESKNHYLEPWSVPGIEAPIDKMAKIILAQPRTKIISQDSQYIHATFTSLIFRYVDDVYFFHDTENQLMHYKSASRVGHSDLGANKKRIQLLKGIYFK